MALPDDGLERGVLYQHLVGLRSAVETENRSQVGSKHDILRGQAEKLTSPLDRAKLDRRTIRKRDRVERPRGLHERRLGTNGDRAYRVRKTGDGACRRSIPLVQLADVGAALGRGAVPAEEDATTSIRPKVGDEEISWRVERSPREEDATLQRSSDDLGRK